MTVIPAASVESYLNRQVESFKWLKRLPRKKLLKALANLDIPWGTDLQTFWHNQLVMYLIGIYMPGFLFFADMGTGKTRVSLELIKYRRKTWLVCVPNEANIENWLVEIETYTPHLSCQVLNSSKPMLLRNEADIFLIHYPGLVALCSNLVKTPRSKRRQRRIDPQILHFIKRKFDGLVLDESTAVGNHLSLTSKICADIAKSCDFVYCLTGTPFGRDPLPLWHQFKVVDSGRTLGSLGMFREAFFSKRRNYWGGVKYSFRKLRRKQLRRLISNRSITYSEGECQDLPERVLIKKIVHMHSTLEPYYQTELTKLRQAKGNFVEIKNSFIRMRQLSSGFLGLKNDTSGEKIQIEFPDNPKIDALMQIIEEMPATARILIYHEYIWTGNRISEELTKRKIKHVRLHGAEKDPRGQLRRFKEDPSVKCFVLNNNSGSMGLNLQEAHYVCFVETSQRPIIRQQAERRARRGGQKAKSVFIIDIVAHGPSHSIDERILEWLQEGKSLLKDILDGRTTI